jgi:ribosomal protein S12
MMARALAMVSAKDYPEVPGIRYMIIRENAVFGIYSDMDEMRSHLKHGDSFCDLLK